MTDNYEKALEAVGNGQVFGDESGVAFLLRKGMRRDKADYVAAVVRIKADLQHLLKGVSDASVMDEIEVLCEFIEDSVHLMHEMARAYQPPRGGGGGNNAA